MALIVTIGFLILAWILSELFFAPLFGLAVSLVLFALSGAIAGRLIRGSDYGFAGNIGLGLVGGIVGNLIFTMILGWKISEIAIIGPIVVGVLGAVIMVIAVRILHNADFGR